MKKVEKPEPLSLAHGLIVSMKLFTGHQKANHLEYIWKTGPSLAKDWKSYEIIKTILESGTKAEADPMMNMPTTTEDSETENGTGEYTSTIFLAKVWKIQKKS